jgi:hypothetical protein
VPLLTNYVPVYFAPDQDPAWTANPGVLSYVGNLVPSTRGTLVNWTSAISERVGAAPVTAQVSSDIPRSAVVLKRVGASTDRRYFLGTDNRLLEYNMNTNAPTDVSRTAGGPYAASEWAFDTFGDVMLAMCSNPSSGAHPTEYPQKSQGNYGTAFAAMTGSPNNPPKAALGVVQSNFLVLFNVYDGATWLEDGWMCSGLGDLTSWNATVNGVADLTTGANNGRFLATPGPVRAAYVQRDTIVVYKQDSMYVMTYSGNPYTFQTRLIADNIGQSNMGGVAVVNGVHYFIHRSGVFKFDGSYPQNIGLGIVDNFLSRLNPTSNLYTLPGIKAAVSEDLNLIVWYVPTLSVYGIAGCANAALAYNYVTGKFGWIDRVWDDQSATIGHGCPLVGTRSELGGPFEFPLYPFVNFGVEGTNLTLRGVNINKGSRTSQTTATLYTGDVGDEKNYSKLIQVKPRLINADRDGQTSSVNVDYKASEGDVYTGAGFLFSSVASGAGAGPLLEFGTLRNWATLDARTILAGDYIAFDTYLLSGDLATVAAVQIGYSGHVASQNPYVTAAFAAQGVWRTNLISLAADVGFPMVSLLLVLNSAGAAGSQQIIFRNFRITDSTGAIRERLCFAGEERSQVFDYNTAAGVFAAGTAVEVPSIGTAYTYDSTRRRFDGLQSGRWLKIKMSLYNKTELAGLYVTTEPAGTE